MNLQNATALVTGGTSAIANAIAKVELKPKRRPQQLLTPSDR